MSDVTYEEKLRGLSEASVHKHFDAFEDIAWDDPAYAIVPGDPRWVLPTVDPLGAHPWYQAQPLDRQIEIGLWRMANIAKVGLQFENVLIRGLMDYAMTIPNESPEFRYVTHEATEETHHTQMFQEFVNRSGTRVPGARKAFRRVAPYLPLAAYNLPEIFFTGVLAGEEPIDHLQKQYLRAAHQLHPLMARIMQIHVAEEARHISFAHEYLRERVGELGPVRRRLFAAMFPVVMRVLCDVIMTPPKELTEKLGVPKEVVKDCYWRSPESRALLEEIFGDVRMLADDLGIRTPVMRRVWRRLGIDGRPSRYRGETHERAAA
jgi:hypothetical protein